MKDSERVSSRSKPRRFRMSSRKSVSAEACSSSIRAWARANCALSLRIVDLSPDATAPRVAASVPARLAPVRLVPVLPGADLRGAVAPFRRFAAPEPAAVVFFFMRILVEACL
ncbi:hypothetical protein ACVILL_001450 [Bradyrhizobium sp. USDA 3364]